MNSVVQIAAGFGGTELRYALGIVAALLVIAALAGWRRRPHGASQTGQAGASRPSAPDDAALSGDLGQLLAALETVSSRLDGKLSEVQSALDEADKRISALRILIEASSQAAPPGVGLGASPADPRHQPVYALADEGLSAIAIAQRLGQSVGEIELILRLRTVAQN